MHGPSSTRRPTRSGPPFGLLRRLRPGAPVTLGRGAGASTGSRPGRGSGWSLRHADVEWVLRDPATFSSWLGATQVRDAADLRVGRAG